MYHSEKNRLNKFVLLVFLSIIISISGCSHKVITKNNPNYTAKKVSEIYLQRSEKDLKFHVYSVLKDELELLGFTVFMGTERTPTNKVDVIISYEDRWMWDMSNYLLKLDVFLVDADNMVSISETSILRTSLIRKDRKHVAREAFSELFFSPENRETYLNTKVLYDGSSEISNIYLYLDDDAKKYEKVISFFFSKKNLNFSASDLKFPSEEFTTICNIYTLRGKKYLQFKDRERNKLIAEVFLEDKTDEKKDRNLNKKILARLETLFSLHNDPNNDPPYFYLNP